LLIYIYTNNEFVLYREPWSGKLKRAVGKMPGHMLLIIANISQRTYCFMNF